MRSSFPPLSCLLAFESAAWRLSFTLAATELSLTPSTISHQIAKLEEFLEIKLFERNGRTLAITAAGSEYLSRLSGALDAISAATDNVRKGVSNTLHVHSSPSFATVWLMPRLADFARKHPEIALSFSSSVAYSDFEIGMVDIDIRYGHPHWPHLHVEPIFEERIMPLASPQFIASHSIRTPEDLIDVPLIQSAVNVVQWRDWFLSRGMNFAPTRFAYRFDRSAMALEAAVQGLGVAFDSTSIGLPHIESGRLQAVFDEDWCLKVHAHFMVLPNRYLQRPEVMKFIQWVHSQNQPAAAQPDL
jgi:LysR family glycine cleavage system transcriptional activator